MYTMECICKFQAQHCRVGCFLMFAMLYAVQPFHERIPFKVMHLHSQTTDVLVAGKLNGTVSITELPGELCCPKYDESISSHVIKWIFPQITVKSCKL